MTEPNTGYYAIIIADSINNDGSRLTTFEVCFPRFILAEFNTHRVFSRNSASSRAIPIAKQLERIDKYPFVPEAFPINKPGMSASEYIGPDDKRYEELVNIWMDARYDAVNHAIRLMDLNVHKQTANRLLEPFMWHSVVVTSNYMSNFFGLRISPHAQPEINKIALMMQNARDGSVPLKLSPGEWHLPYVTDEEIDSGTYTDIGLAKISAGRCAAVTLLNQQNKEPDRDIKRTEGLIINGHMSPLEHPAKSWYCRTPSNFDGTWTQYRKLIPNEDVFIDGEM